LKGFKYEGVVIYVLEKMIPGVTCRMDWEAREQFRWECIGSRKWGLWLGWDSGHEDRYTWMFLETEKTRLGNGITEGMQKG
jgi:hypothetical protein